MPMMSSAPIDPAAPLGGAIDGGSYELREQGGVTVPVFAFHAPDLARAEAVLKDMYVDLDVRFNQAGRLAYHLGVPDRQLTPAAIPVGEHDLPRVMAGAALLNTCITVVVDDHGGTLDLERFCSDLEHDWTRNYATGLREFQAGNLDAAVTPLQFLVDTESRAPAVHHLLGRCHRARGDLNAAVHHYLGAVRNACSTTDDRMLPIAAGVLSDMGVAFKKLGMSGKSAHCFLHSLHLRPNHPEALLTFVTLFPQTEALVLYGLGRVVAIGGHDSTVDQVVTSIAAARNRDAADLRSKVEGAAARVDLAVWPLARPDLAQYSTFHEGLERLGMHGQPGDPAASALADTLPARPWWKFW